MPLDSDVPNGDEQLHVEFFIAKEIDPRWDGKPSFGSTFLVIKRAWLSSPCAKITSADSLGNGFIFK